QILWTFWSSKVRFDFRKIDFHKVCVDRIFVVNCEEHAVLLQIFFSDSDLVCITCSQTHIVKRFFVNWEESASCAVFWSHVGNRCTVSKWQCCNTRAEELNKFTYNTFFTQSLCNFQRQIGCSSTVWKFASHFNSDNFRNRE